MSKRKKDIVRKRYFRSNKRQADLLNAYIKNYELSAEENQVWMPFTEENFTEKNSELFATTEKKGKTHSGVRTVDSARLVTYGEGKFLFFLEHQEKTDYAMPGRILYHEAICYHEQIHILRLIRKEEKQLHTAAEYLSGIKKDDRLIPAISLVLYYGSEPWNGPADIKGLLDEQLFPGKLRALIRNYPMNLIQIKDIDYLEDFQTDMHETFGFIKFQQDIGKLKHFIKENQRNFENLSEDAYDFIACQTGIRKLELIKKNYKTEEGDYNMCKAIRDMEEMSRQEGMQEGRQEGIQEGMQEGRRAGERDNAIQIARLLFKKGASMELVAASILNLKPDELNAIYCEVHATS